MNELINRNQTSLRLYKKEIETAMRNNQRVCVKKMLHAVKDFELGLNFFAESQKLNVKGAKLIDKQLKKIDNKLMNKQLFETDKLQCMIISENDGSQTVTEGTDEVTRQYADYMKEMSNIRQQIIDEMIWIRQNCKIGILTSA